MKNVLLLINPQAGGGRVARLLPAIEQQLVQIGLVPEIHRSVAMGDIRQRLSATDLSGFDAVIAAGGDGTLFEAVNGLMAHPAESRPPLGVLPIGTGNAFCRDLGLQPGDWQAALALIMRAKIRQIDVARLDCADGQFYFVNIAGVGLVVDAGRTAQKLKVLGRAAYTLAALWQILKLRSYAVRIEVDGQGIEQNSLFAEISNSRYTGTSFLIAPAARLDDGLLHLTLVCRLPRTRLLRLFPSIYSGKHVEYPEVTVLQGKEISILQPQNCPMMMDGEFIGTTPARICCLPGVLPMFG